MVPLIHNVFAYSHSLIMPEMKVVEIRGFRTTRYNRKIKVVTGLSLDFPKT
jgi:hypothetical protein